MKEKQELKYQLKILPVLHTGAKANISWCVNRLGLLRNIVFLKVMTQSARKSSGEKKAYSIAKKKLHRQLNLDFWIRLHAGRHSALPSFINILRFVASNRSVLRFV